MENRMYVLWTVLKDEQLLHDYLAWAEMETFCQELGKEGRCLARKSVISSCQKEAG
jgi:hypothetical protein